MTPYLLTPEAGAAHREAVEAWRRYAAHPVGGGHYRRYVTAHAAFVAAVAEAHAAMGLDRTRATLAASLNYPLRWIGDHFGYDSDDAWCGRNGIPVQEGQR